MSRLPRKLFAWTFRTRETVYTNPWITVETIDARDPSGSPAAYGVVRFANLAVGIVPYADGHIWLVGQSRVPFETYSWEIPAGGGDPAQAEAAAHRELREETGLNAKNMRPIVRMQLSNSVTDEACIIFLATDLTQGDTALESSEDITVMKLSLSEALAHVETGEIVDSLSVAAIYKLALMQHRGELDGE